VIEQTFDGFISVPRGVFRSVRHELRRHGVFGTGEAVQVMKEDILLGQIFGEALTQSGTSKAAFQAVLDTRGVQAGARIVSSPLIGFAIRCLPCSAGISTMAIYGDVYYSIENGATSIEEIFNAGIAGEVGP